ncbi:MAG TPA: dirigent protein [Thermomicrobiales bacterium]|nr:dirigent protein [Thermomicrobiales bacterium]
MVEEDVMRRMPLIVGAIAFPLGVMLGGVLTHTARADEKITVIEHATTDTTIDLAAKGDSVGDTLVFANDVYDAQDATKVGTDQGHCVRTVVGKAWECTWTVFLADGQIVVQGPFYDSGDSTLAIIGGTGKYVDATGEMTLKARDNGTKYEFTYDVDD